VFSPLCAKTPFSEFCVQAAFSLNESRLNARLETIEAIFETVSNKPFCEMIS